MDGEKELEDMPIWQNHEQRITQLEVTTANINNEFSEIKKKIDDGNNEQKDKLDTIDKRLMDEFFNKKNTTRDNVWKLLIALVGGGSFLYLIIEKIMEVI